MTRVERDDPCPQDDHLSLRELRAALRRRLSGTAHDETVATHSTPTTSLIRDGIAVRVEHPGYVLERPDHPSGDTLALRHLLDGRRPVSAVAVPATENALAFLPLTAPQGPRCPQLLAVPVPLDEGTNRAGAPGPGLRGSRATG